MKKSNHNLPHLKSYRRQLRKHGTRAEALLWLALKNKQLQGRRFRRQYSIGNYILDFYCPAEKLAIELDGESHNDVLRVSYDDERTRFLERQGIRVIRIENEVVYASPGELLEYIAGFFGTAA